MKTIPSPRPKPSHQRPTKTIPSPRPKPSHQRPMKTTPSPRPKPAHQRPMKTIPSPRPNSIRKKNHASSFRPSAAASEPEDDLSRSNQGSDTRTKQTNPTPVLEFDRHLNPVPPSRHVPNSRSWNPPGSNERDQRFLRPQPPPRRHPLTEHSTVSDGCRTQLVAASARVRGYDRANPRRSPELVIFSIAPPGKLLWSGAAPPSVLRVLPGIRLEPPPARRAVPLRLW